MSQQENDPRVYLSLPPAPPSEMHQNLLPSSVVQGEDVGSIWELVGNAEFQAPL